LLLSCGLGGLGGPDLAKDAVLDQRLVQQLPLGDLAAGGLSFDPRL
jgi:hypothetical protein